VATITNVSGQVVKRQSLNNSGEMKLQVEELPAGTYWIVLQGKSINAVSYTGQFVKN
jgi:hypothetical protein